MPELSRIIIGKGVRTGNEDRHVCYEAMSLTILHSVKIETLGDIRPKIKTQWIEHLSSIDVKY